MIGLVLWTMSHTVALAAPCSPVAAVEDGAYRPAQTVAFEPRTANPTPETVEAMAAVACALKAEPTRTIHIGVHTDSQGSGAYNQRVSQERADALKAALIAEGIPEDRIAAHGYGESIPIAPNTTAEGRSQNRRIELRTTDPGHPKPTAPEPRPEPRPAPQPVPDPCSPLPTPGTSCSGAQLCPVDTDTYIECMHGEWVRITERPMDPTP